LIERLDWTASLLRTWAAEGRGSFAERFAEGAVEGAQILETRFEGDCGEIHSSGADELAGVVDPSKALVVEPGMPGRFAEEG